MTHKARDISPLERAALIKIIHRNINPELTIKQINSTTHVRVHVMPAFPDEIRVHTRWILTRRRTTRWTVLFEQRRNETAFEIFDTAEEAFDFIHQKYDDIKNKRNRIKNRRAGQ